MSGPASTDPGEPDIRVLERTHDLLVREAARLRDARRSITSQLGPFPAAGALVIGLFASIADSTLWASAAIGAALIPFAAMIAVSTHFGRGRPARSWLRKMEFMTGERDTVAYVEWLRVSVAQWRGLYPDLERAFDDELRGLRIVQALLAVEVMYLVSVTVVATYLR